MGISGIAASLPDGLGGCSTGPPGLGGRTEQQRLAVVQMPHFQVQWQRGLGSRRLVGKSSLEKLPGDGERPIHADGKGEYLL